MLHHAIEALLDVVVPERQDPVALICQPSVAKPVAGVLAAIGFDRQGRLKAAEIDDL